MDKLADVHEENYTNEQKQHQSAEKKKKVYKPYMMTRDKKLEKRKIQGWIHRQKFEGNYPQPKIQFKTKQKPEKPDVSFLFYEINQQNLSNVKK